MPSIASTPVVEAWRDGAALEGGISTQWRDGTQISSLGSAYTPPAAPAGTTPSVTTLNADWVLDNASSTTSLICSVQIIDLRDSAQVQFFNARISTDADSIVWTLNATCSPDCFSRFTTGVDLPVIKVTLNTTEEWVFLVESVSRSRAYGSSAVSITGRSLTITAGEPHTFASNWINEGPASAAQLIDQAQLYTGLEVSFGLDDWLVPDRVWSFTGTPLAVAKRVAESVGAVLSSSRTDFRISLNPRYGVLPNEWATTAPNVDIYLGAILSDSYARADQPPYNGVYLSGQQQGAVGHVFLAGTTGNLLAPFATDLLLTDLAAIRQRGIAILGASGKRALVTHTLPVYPGPGVLRLGWLARVYGDNPIANDGTKWWGMVRTVDVEITPTTIQQTIGFERHLDSIPGTIITEVK